MKRKTIQMSQATQLVSMPADWVRRNNIKKGTTVNVEEFDNKIMVFYKDEERHAEVDLKDYNERMIRWLISSYYKLGYNEMIFKFHTEKQLKEVQNLISKITTGFTINIQKNKIIIKNLLKDNEEEFRNTLEKAFLITISMGENIVEANKTHQKNFLQKIKETEEVNNQLTNYCERAINKKLINKSNLEYIIAWNLEKIADKFKLICDMELKKEDIIALEQINKALFGFKELYFNFSLKKLQVLEKQRIKNQKFSDLISSVYDFGTTILMLNENYIS